jgi:hypothetical protein
MRRVRSLDIRATNGGEVQMKWYVTVTAALVLSGVALVSTASADPSHNIGSPETLTCNNGQTVLVNPGTVTNNSHEGFVISSSGTISSTSIDVINYLAFTDSTGTTVIFDTAPGLTAQGLVTCTTDLGGGVTLTLRGFFTPR